MGRDITNLDYDRVTRTLQEAHNDLAELHRTTERLEGQIAELTELKAAMEIYKIRRMAGEA